MDMATGTCGDRTQELATLGIFQRGLVLTRNVSLLRPAPQPLYYGAWQKALEKDDAGRTVLGELGRKSF